MAVPEQRGGMEAFAGTLESGKHGGLRKPLNYACRPRFLLHASGNLEKLLIEVAVEF
ncbi:MAG: hypothetical protein J5930_06900 [Treponema sp.]|nr:hypothetical protein [Treponema sp.]